MSWEKYQEIIKTRTQESTDAYNTLLNDEEFMKKIADATGAVVDVLKKGGTLLACGNGGSAVDALHFVEEVKGKFESAALRSVGVKPEFNRLTNELARILTVTV